MNTTHCPFNNELISSVLKGNIEDIKALLSKGANVNEQDTNGQIPLIRAVWESHTSVVKFLLENGADINIADAEGWTALKYAEELGENEISRLLQTETGYSTSLKSEQVTSIPNPKEVLISDITISRDWRDAVGIGTLIGGLVLIGIALTVKPQSQLSTTGNSTDSSSSNSAVISSVITEKDAVNLISNWLEAKRKLFASPYDRQIAAEYTTEVLYQDITKSGGTIDWLQDNNAYYTFGVQKVEPTGVFSASGDRATIEVRVTEDRTFYVNGKVNDTQTDFDTTSARYTLYFTDGRWKIADYK
ncbi:MAG: IMS domain-containing protein [Geitlerinemataceae cyanobacterium]